MGETATWELINPRTSNTVAAYADRAEADDAAAWYEASFGERLLVVGFGADGIALKESTGDVSLLNHAITERAGRRATPESDGSGSLGGASEDVSK